MPVDLVGLSLTDTGAAVTAFATVALFVVTWVLAKGTRRLANLTSQPQVVASGHPTATWRAASPECDYPACGLWMKE